MTELSKDELRQLIRQVIHEVLDDLPARPAAEQQLYSGPPLTEKRVMQYAREGVSSLVLAKQVVVTPLARAKIRQLGIRLTHQEDS